MLTPLHSPRESMVADAEQPPVDAAGSVLVLDAAALAGLRALDPVGNNRLLERVLAAFETSTSRLMPQLLDAHRHGDLQGIRYVAHTLKSSAACVGGVRLSGICTDLESRIRLEQDGDLTPMVQSLVDETDKLLLALQRLSASDA